MVAPAAAAAAEAANHFVWDIDPVLVHLGSMPIRYYGVLFAAAIYVGYLLLKWQFKKGGVDETKADHFFLYGTIGIVVGARLGHVLFYEPDAFFANPLEILKIWKGGLASHGATLGIILAILIFVKRHKMPIVEVMDRLSMGIALGSSCVRLGNFFNGEIVGRVSDVPWAVVFTQYDNQPRHPSQLYEVAIGITVFIVLFLVDRKLGGPRRRGIIASLFFLCYFSLRFLVEFVKEEQVDFLSRHHSPLTMGQLLSIPFIVAGAILLYFALKGRFGTSGAAPQPAAAGAPRFIKKKKR